MAKLANITEQERSLGSVLRFVFRESIKGSRSTIPLYILSAVRASFIFLEFGALANIVNEFTSRGISGARPWFLVGNFILIAASSIIPAVITSIADYLANVQSDDISRYLQRKTFLQMDMLDIGTIEQPEFQNLFEIADGRGWGSFFSIAGTFTNSLGNIVALMISVVSLMVLSPTVVAVIIVGALPIYFLERKNAILSSELWRRSSETRRMYASKAGILNRKNELIELKNFNIVKVFMKKYDNLILGFHNDKKKLKKKSARNEVLATILLVGAYAIAFLLIILKVYAGALVVGSLVFSFSVITRFQTSLNALFENFGRMVEYKKNVDKLMDFFELRPHVADGVREIDPTQPVTIEMKNVSFAYPGSDHQVLENISVSFKTGDNIAIVGLNGAGKTTLIKLLMRVYDPTSGEIFVNEIPLREYRLQSWKQCLGILLQEYSMYADETIYENIKLGNVTSSAHEMVEQVAKETTADEFIDRLDNRYEQLVGTEFEGGVELSKGQKQKLALARVMYRNAPIMILDEPTASVDALSEDAIFKNLKEKHPNQARIIISHKFSNVRDADQIILIEHGRIIEQGTHDQLMQMHNGKYKELFELQAEGYR